MNGTRSVGADGGEEILSFEAVDDIVEFFAIAGKEDGAGSGTVADADDVTLNVFGTIVCWCEGLVEAAVTGGGVSY